MECHVSGDSTSAGRSGGSGGRGSASGFCAAAAGSASGICAAAAGSALGSGRSLRRGGGPGSCGGPGRTGEVGKHRKPDAGAAPGVGAACPCTASMLIGNRTERLSPSIMWLSGTVGQSQMCSSTETCGDPESAGSLGHCEGEGAQAACKSGTACTCTGSTHGES